MKVGFTYRPSLTLVPDLYPFTSLWGSRVFACRFLGTASQGEMGKDSVGVLACSVKSYHAAAKAELAVSAPIVANCSR